MPDDLTNRGPQDRARVNVREPYEVRYRCKEWGCTEGELKAAVKATGSLMADKIEAYLKSQGHKRK